MVKTQAIAPTASIEPLIFLIRGHRVMLDSDLGALYGVPTKVLVQAARRNKERFPQDFMFQLSTKEFKTLRSQTVTSNAGRGGRRYAPYAFTEQGVAMLSSVLRSKRAVLVNIRIMRAFVKLRKFLATQHKLALKLVQLEKRLGEHDDEIAAIFEAIRQLMQPPEKPARRIGFHG